MNVLQFDPAVASTMRFVFGGIVLRLLYMVFDVVHMRGEEGGADGGLRQKRRVSGYHARW